MLGTIAWFFQSWLRYLVQVLITGPSYVRKPLMVGSSTSGLDVSSVLMVRCSFFNFVKHFHSCLNVGIIKFSVIRYSVLERILDTGVHGGLYTVDRRPLERSTRDWLCAATLYKDSHLFNFQSTPFTICSECMIT
jgi:hypothetical protein